MADFANIEDAPVLGAIYPRTVRDLGAILTKATNPGAGTFDSPDQKNLSSRGVKIIFDLVKVSGTIDVTVKIFSKDAGTGKSVQRLASVSLTASGTTEYVVHPDLAAANNSVAKDFIGETFYVEIVSGAGSSPNFTFTVGAVLLP